jgi:tetratricopeptide (TPR) repeat protein
MGEKHIPWTGRQQQRPLVGRERELAQLYQLVEMIEGHKSALPGSSLAMTDMSAPIEHLDNAQTDMISTPLAILLGEAGIGKTRLAEELSAMTSTRGWNVLWNRGYVQEGHIPYRLWIELLRSTWKNELWPQAMYTQIAPCYYPLVSLLPELTGVIPARALSRSHHTSGDLYEAVLTLLIDISAQAPLLIVIDDLQWADESSIDLLGYLARRVSHLPLLFVCTCRNTDIPAAHPLHQFLRTMLREHVITQCPVSALTNEQVRLLISELPPDLTRRIQQQAAGNPYFVEELARLCTGNLGSQKEEHIPPSKRTALSTSAASVTLNACVTDPVQVPTMLPQTITTLLDRRLLQLSPDCQKLLSHAAILGNALSFSLLYMMENTGNDHMDEQTLRALLDEALQASILTEERSIPSIDEDSVVANPHVTYSFWHPLLIEHLCKKLSATRQARLHRRAAEVLIHIYAEHEEEGAARILRHLEFASDDVERITHYARIAGDYAWRILAYPEAEQHYRTVLIQQEMSLALLSQQEQYQLANLHERLAECMRIQGRFAQARAAYEQVLDIYQQNLHEENAAQEQYNAQLQALLWCEIGMTWHNAGNISQARQCYLRGEQILQQIQIFAGPVLAYLRFQQSYAYWSEGRYQEARACANEALHLFETSSFPQVGENETFMHLTRTGRILAGDPINLGRVHVLLGMIACGEGDEPNTLLHFHEALDLYERHDYQREIGIVSCNLGHVYLRRAEHSQAQIHFQRALALATRVGELPSEGVAAGNLGILALHTGKLREAERWLGRSIAIAKHVDESVYACIWHTQLTLVMLELGREDEARGYLLQAFRLARSTRITSCRNGAFLASGFFYWYQACKQVNTLQHLRHARYTLLRLLASPGVEVEIFCEGQLLLAQVFVQLGMIEQGYQLVQQAWQTIQQCELIWLFSRTYYVFACVHAARGEIKQAEAYFLQASDLAQCHNMDLEHAHTLQQFADMLQQQNTVEHLQRAELIRNQAQQMYMQCHTTGITALSA